MRWQQLFTDLQAEFDEAAAREERAELPSRSRAETSTVRLAERIGGAVGGRVSLRCRGAGEVAGRLTAGGGGGGRRADGAGRGGCGGRGAGAGGRGQAGGGGGAGGGRGGGERCGVLGCGGGCWTVGGG